ncbi:MAG TPA: putative metal-dependent hydrolase [Gemmatimonadaceae bacterium]
MTDLRYPTGQFVPPDQPTSESRARAIDVIAETPEQLRAAVQGLDEVKLDTPYREGGWTLRQVVHHVPDSHLNAYVRLKLALTEPAPVIKPYDEAAWATLVDTTAVPIDVSLNLLEALHRRWVALLRGMRDDDFRREYVHPETGRHQLDHLVALYAWHGPHHIAHITTTRRRMGW